MSRNQNAARMETTAAVATRTSARKNNGKSSIANHKYEAIPASTSEDSVPREFRYSVDLPDDHHVLLGEHLKQLQKRNKKQLAMTGVFAFTCIAWLYWAFLYVVASHFSLAAVVGGLETFWP